MEGKVKAMATKRDGRELEEAVRAIEEAILTVSPHLREQPFKFESRKVIKANGARHEIDIFVTVDLSPRHSSTFIFECKDWNDPVGKNEIIVFSRKIAATSAQHGYFVAPAYTKDARAEAALDPRLILLTVKKGDAASSISPDFFHTTSHSPAQSKVDVRIFTTAAANPQGCIPVDMNQRLMINGEELNGHKYIDRWITDLYEEHLKEFPTWNLSEGLQFMPGVGERFFDPGTCQLGEQEVRMMRITAQFAITIIRPAIKSDFEVASRGRAISYEKVSLPNIEFTLSLVKEFE